MDGHAAPHLRLPHLCPGQHGAHRAYAFSVEKQMDQKIEVKNGD